MDARGQLIAETGAGYEVVVRDAESGDEYRRLIHRSQVIGLAFGPDDRSVVTVAVDNIIRAWMLGHGSAVDELAHADPIESAKFVDEDLVTRSKSATRRWRLPRPEEMAATPVERNRGEDAARAFSVHLSARITEDHNQMELVNETGNTVRTLDFSTSVGAAAVSPSGRRLGVLLSRDVLTRRMRVRPTIEVWDLERTQRLSAVTPEDEVSRSDFGYVSFDPDERYLVTRTDDGFRLWDARTLSLLHRVFHGDPERIAFQPAGPLAATASADRTVRIWRVEDKTLTEVARLRSRSKMTDVGIDRKGHWLAAVGEDGRTSLWVIPPGELIAQACGRISGRCRQ